MSVCNVICTFYRKMVTKFELVATNTNMNGENLGIKIYRIEMVGR